MRIRKLNVSEHAQTRPLWEEVFPEDTKEFLDYYYFIKTRENEIYVIEEDEEIRSMLQLNPYLLQVEENQFPCHYIIAVATQEAYRKRGYMGALLRQSMQDMYARKEPFTFLMPAAEAIYTPYDFRFVYKQTQSEKEHFVNEDEGYTVQSDLTAAEWKGRDLETEIELVDAGLGDAAELADFFQEHFAFKYQVCAVHDEKYYQTMIFEQMSENGGVKIMRQACGEVHGRKGQIVGCFAYARDEGTAEIREPLYLAGFEKAFYKGTELLHQEINGPVKLYAAPEEEGTKRVPVIMVRILHLETLLKAMKVREGEILDCSFAVVDPIISQNSRIWRLRSGEEDSCIQVCETEDSEGLLTISALASFLFGYKRLEEITEEDVYVVIPDKLKEELEKIEPLKRIFLNEVV